MSGAFRRIAKALTGRLVRVPSDAPHKAARRVALLAPAGGPTGTGGWPHWQGAGRQMRSRARFGR